MAEKWHQTGPHLTYQDLTFYFLTLLPLRAAPSVHLHPASLFTCLLFVRTFESACQLPGKEHVCQFALAVCQSAVVAPLAVKVVETDPAKVVCQR